jgi:hypothetical protein
MIKSRNSGAVSPDMGEARAFIEAIGGSADASFTFQMFDDAGLGRRGLARWRHGTLRTLANDLTEASAAGAGVFVMVNEGDGTGRRAACVIALRALFVDDDAGALASPATLPPTAVVSTRRGSHMYWGLHPGEDVARFKQVQQALSVRLGTDPAVCDLPRVMRLPGFPHLKDPADPFMVRVAAASGARYTITEVVERLRLDIVPPAQEARLFVAAGRRVGRVRLRIVMNFYADNWRPGRRHHLALSFGAYCRHAGVELDEALVLVTHVAYAGGEDPGPEWDGWRQAVVTSYTGDRASVHHFLALHGLTLPHPRSRARPQLPLYGKDGTK